MKLIILHKNNNSTISGGMDLLRFAVSSEPLAGVLLDGLSGSLSWDSDAGFVFAIPEEWGAKLPANGQRILSYLESVPICSELLRQVGRHLWFVISNGRFATQVDSGLLNKVLTTLEADVVAVNIEPALQAGREKVRLTAQSGVGGIRRLYADSAELSPLPADWPHHIFIKTKILDQLLSAHTLPQSFSDFIERCRARAVTLYGVRIGGSTLDLETEDGLLGFCSKIINLLPSRRFHKENRDEKSVVVENNATRGGTKLVGKVLMGENVEIGPKAIVIGPTIIGDNVKVCQGAVIKSSIIGPEVCVPRNQFIDNCVVKGARCDWDYLSHAKMLIQSRFIWRSPI